MAHTATFIQGVLLDAPDDPSGGTLIVNGVHSQLQPKWLAVAESIHQQSTNLTTCQLKAVHLFKSHFSVFGTFVPATEEQN